MFYKHWKKLSLALTAFFWASCNNNTTVTQPPLYGCPPGGCEQPNSSSEATPESSAAAPSSSETVSSSSQAESSSSFVLPAPAYGVVATPCYEDGKGVKTNDEIAETKLYCEDGVVCKEREVLKDVGPEPCYTHDDGDLKGAVVCPDYGVVIVTEKTYNCNGIKFNEAEFRSRYYNAGIKPPSSSSSEQSSSSQVSCGYDPTSIFYNNRSEQYTESAAISDATSQAKWDATRKISDIVIEQFKDKDVPKCLEKIQESLESEFAPVYGAPKWGTPTPKELKCSDGTTIPTKEYLEQLAFDEEQKKKKPQYDEKYNEVYKKETEKLEEKINNCLESNQPISSSSEGTPKSSSSAEVTCTPGDSTVSYYPPSYSADIAKMSAGERAKRAGVAKIDSLKKTLQTTPQCLENLRQELDMLVALYGAPTTFPKDEVCSDGTTRATKEYLEYLKMKEEWEENKPALDAECQKIYEDKLNEIKQRIEKCLKSDER